MAERASTKKVVLHRRETDYTSPSKLKSIWPPSSKISISFSVTYPGRKLDALSYALCTCMGMKTLILFLISIRSRYTSQINPKFLDYVPGHFLVLNPPRPISRSIDIFQGNPFPSLFKLRSFSRTCAWSDQLRAGWEQG